MVDYQVLPKNKKGEKHTDIEKIFNESFPNDENSAENINAFKLSKKKKIFFLKKNLNNQK